MRFLLVFIFAFKLLIFEYKNDKSEICVNLRLLNGKVILPLISGYKRNHFQSANISTYDESGELCG